ncbi:unnamed protein product [Adineta ricciae]|uniref:Uncharacterized protein n=1 Tax=Adineta ricciae TaxID=249248 RepID=A0A813UFD9_ADIRI|nr:unnamed protein product [Adineta ricciae]
MVPSQANNRTRTNPNKYTDGGPTVTVYQESSSSSISNDNNRCTYITHSCIQMKINNKIQTEKTIEGDTRHECPNG